MVHKVTVIFIISRCHDSYDWMKNGKSACESIFLGSWGSLRKVKGVNLAGYIRVAENDSLRHL